MSVLRSTPSDFFEAQEVTLNVGSSPIAGVPFKLDGAQHVTPYTESMLPTVKSLEAYPSVVAAGRLYVFQMWDDGVTSLSRTADLTVKTSYLMIYLPAQEAPAVSPQLNYTPLIILASIFIFGAIVICYLATIGRR